MGSRKRDLQFVNLGQAQIISAMTSDNGDIAGVWAPNTYTLEEKAEPGCSVPALMPARSCRAR